jgi:hypothetical protein
MSEKSSSKKDIWIDARVHGKVRRIIVFFYAEVAGGNTREYDTESEFSPMPLLNVRVRERPTSFVSSSKMGVFIN